MQIRKNKQYISRLKSDIISFTTNFKKRYKLFPWVKINKLTKSELRSSSRVTLHGNDYTILSLVGEMRSIKKIIDTSLKPNYFNHYIMAFNRDSRNCKSDEEYENLYKGFKEELDLEFKQLEEKLIFCIDALKEINKTLNKKDDTIEESALKSTLDSDHEQKGKKNLNEFKKVEINRNFIKKYTPRTKLLKSIEAGEFGYAWIDNENDLVGYVLCNKEGWITAIELTREYRGYGLSRQLMIYAMKHMGGNRLGVHKDNKIAINLYTQLGFKIVPAEKIGGSGERNMIFMLRAGTKPSNTGNKPNNINKETKESEDINMFNAENYLATIESEIFSESFNAEAYLESLMDDLFGIDPKQAVYEACNRGEITIEEREEILADMNNKKYLENTTDDILNNYKESGVEKFENIKKVLYEKCANNEISVESREALINKAHEMLFAVESDIQNDMAEASIETTKKISKELNKTLNSNKENIAKKINA